MLQDLSNNCRKCYLSFLQIHPSRQADAFGGYDGIYATGDVIEVACWAHARRKFHEARSTDSNRAHRMLAWIRQLYDIERDGKKLDADARRALRHEKSKPLFEGSKGRDGSDDIQGIHDWLIEQHAAVLPKSPIGDAIGYALNQWTALTRYLDDGDLDIDNNEAEQALRGIAIGRNYAQYPIMLSKYSTPRCVGPISAGL